MYVRYDSVVRRNAKIPIVDANGFVYLLRRIIDTNAHTQQNTNDTTSRHRRIHDITFVI